MVNIYIMLLTYYLYIILGANVSLHSWNCHHPYDFWVATQKEYIQNIGKIHDPPSPACREIEILLSSQSL